MTEHIHQARSYLNPKQSHAIWLPKPHDLAMSPAFAAQCCRHDAALRWEIASMAYRKKTDPAVSAHPVRALALRFWHLELLIAETKGEAIRAGRRYAYACYRIAAAN